MESDLLPLVSLYLGLFWLFTQLLKTTPFSALHQISTISTAYVTCQVSACLPTHPGQLYREMSLNIEDCSQYMLH